MASSSDSGSASGSTGSSPSDSSGSSGSPGGAMGSGGSAETMGSEHPSPETAGGSTDQGSQGSSDQGSAMGSTEMGHSDAEMVKGKLSKVSSQEISITPKGGQAKILKIAKETVVTLNGKDAKPSQLKPGQWVRVRYEDQGGDEVAVMIEASRARQGKHGSGHGGHMQGHPGGTSGSSGSSGGSDAGSSGGSR